MGIWTSKRLLPFSITTIWKLLITPEHMPTWPPFQRVVAEKQSPYQRGDQMTGYRGCLSPGRAEEGTIRP